MLPWACSYAPSAVLLARQGRPSHRAQVPAEPRPGEKRSHPGPARTNPNWNDSQRRAGTVTCRGKTDGQTAPIGKPFDSLTDTSGVYRSASGAPDHRTEIQHFKRLRISIDNPAGRNQDAAGRDDQLGPASLAEAVDNPTMDRRQPGLERDEDTKRELDRRDRPAMGLVDGV